MYTCDIENKINIFKNIMIKDGEVDEVSSWFNINPGIKLGKKSDDDTMLGQIGTIKATMIVIDDINSRAEDNNGLNKYGVDKKNRTSDGRILKTAKDYFDYFVPTSRAHLQKSSYGLVDIDVKLIESKSENGIYTLSGNNSDTYPDRRGGDVMVYVEEALQLAKDELLASADNRDVIYIVATENFERISYGPTDVSGYLTEKIGLKGYGSLVRIGQDSYAKWKTMAFIHELGHDLGLADLYTEGELSQIDEYSGNIDALPCSSTWGIMGYINGVSHDFLGYEKLQLGWLRYDQVDFITEEGITNHMLTPLEVDGGTKLVIIPSENKGVIYVVEYKRATGVDAEPFKEETKPPLKYEGILIYKVDANNAQMENPVIVVNVNKFNPLDEPKQTMRDILEQSVLGSSTGIYKYYDKAAGITISVNPNICMPQNVNEPYIVTVIKENPSTEDRSPVLSDAHFLDYNTIECITNYDLRGIKPLYIKVLKNNKLLKGIKLDHINFRSIRVLIDKDQITSEEDMQNVEIYTEKFSFFEKSNSCKVEKALFKDSNTKLTNAKLEQPNMISLESNENISFLKNEDYEIIIDDDLIIPFEKYTINYDDSGKKVNILFNDDCFKDKLYTGDVKITLKSYSNYNPDNATAIQMRYGRCNGIYITKSGKSILVNNMK